MSYRKSWMSYAEQLQRLIDRGMAVTDQVRALEHLERIGYYRLSGYWFALRERSELLCLLDEHGRKPCKVREERSRWTLSARGRHSRMRWTCTSSTSNCDCW